MPDDLRNTLVVGSRLLAGWACAAIGVLDLSMGIRTDAGTTDLPYLLFHVVLLAGGLLLLGFGKLPKTPPPIGYGVITALALLASGLAALPRTENVCCLSELAVRHGFPLTLVAWDPGQPRHFATAHAVADLVFWFLAGLILLALVSQVLPGRRRPDPAARTEQPGEASTHAEERAAAQAEATPVADDENVGGLP
jgi:hypothetical protein